MQPQRHHLSLITPPPPTACAEDAAEDAQAGYCCDSPPTRPRQHSPSRWQQLKAGWAAAESGAGSSTAQQNGADQDQGGHLPSLLVAKSISWAPMPAAKQQQLHRASTDAADTDAADVLKRCGILLSANSTSAEGEQQESVHIDPDGSLVWGSSSTSSKLAVAASAGGPADSLLTLLQTHQVVDNASGSVNVQPQQSQQQDVHLDLSGVFDYLRQQQQQQSTTAAEQPQNSSRRPGGGSAARPTASSMQRSKAQSQPQQRGCATTTTAGQRTSGSSRRPSGMPAAAAAAADDGQKPAANAAKPLASSSTSRTRSSLSSATARPPALTAKPASAASCAAAPVLPQPPARLVRPQSSAAAQTVPLQQEASNSSTRSTNKLCELQAELQLELAAVLRYRVLRRWRLAAADAVVERARARPMANLLSKRKAMRAWRLAFAARSTCTGTRQQHVQRRTPHAQSVQTVQQQQLHQPQQPQLQQPLTPQHSQGGSKRMQVACQFHSMYHQHCCLLHWHAWAVAAAQARVQQQEQQQLQERQRALAQQQEQLLAEFQLRQQQELEQQQERKRHEVAVRFHQLFTLHSALRTWHKHASMSAALNKLHPALPSAVGGSTGIGSAGGAHATSTSSAAAGSSSSSGRDGGGGSRVRAQGGGGGLDPELVQQKAQQLLQHLANRAAAQPQQQQQHEQQEQQQQQQSERTAPAKPAKVAQAASAGSAAAGVKPSRSAAGHQHSQRQTLSSNTPSAQQQRRLEAPTQQPADVSVGIRDNSGSSGGVVQDQLDAPGVQQQARPTGEEAGSAQSNQHQQEVLLGAQGTSAPAHVDELAVGVPPAPPQPQQQQQQQSMNKAIAVLKTSRTRPQQQKQQQEKPQQHQQNRRRSSTSTDTSFVEQQPDQQVTQQPASAASAAAATSAPSTSAQQQVEWPVQRQRLQQQLRQLQSEEARRLRQHQQVEQQLQALLAEQQWDLALLHADRVLVYRAGLKPWLGLLRLRSQQVLLAGRLHQWHLLTGAMRAFKHVLLCRYKRHTCRHIQACGVLRSLQHQQLQRAALSALHTSALTARHYRRQLLLRALWGWRDSVCAGALVASAAVGALRVLRQRHVVAAWWQWVQDQAHEQLMVELELTAMATGWHTARVQRTALRMWHTTATSAAQQRVTEAAHQQTWSRVRGWLTELEGPIGTATTTAAGSGAAAGGAAAAAARLPATVGGLNSLLSESGWELDDFGGGGDDESGVGVGGNINAYDAAAGSVTPSGGGSVSDLAALAEWFEAAGRDLAAGDDAGGLTDFQ